MSHQIAGNPNSYPVSFAIPDDGDARTAASVNVPFEALADRTANLNALYGNLRGLIPLNFHRVADVGTLRYAFWNEPERRWFGAVYTTVSIPARLITSIDAGETWSQALPATEDVGVNGLVQGDVDSTGNMVVSATNNATRFIEYNASTKTFTARTHAIAAPGVSAPVVYDTFTGRWVWLGSTPSVAQAYFSYDRINWLAGASWTMGPGGFNVLKAQTDRAGTIVAVAGPTNFASGERTVRVHRSIDGMSSQMLVQTITASSLTGIEYTSHPRYNPYDGVWLLPLHQFTGSEKSEIWRSTDGGVSWSLAAELTTAALFDVVPFGQLWVGLTGSTSFSTGGEIVYSTDSGSTWRYTGQRITGAGSNQRSGIFGSPYGLIVTAFSATTNNSMYLGIRVGEGASVVL